MAWCISQWTINMAMPQHGGLDCVLTGKQRRSVIRRHTSVYYTFTLLSVSKKVINSPNVVRFHL